jgi:hypothetical protein
MLNTQVELLRREVARLSNPTAVAELSRENEQLARRIKTLCAYNQAQIERNVERAKTASDTIAEFECICGAKEQLMQDFDNGYSSFVKSAFTNVSGDEPPQSAEKQVQEEKIE